MSVRGGQAERWSCPGCGSANRARPSCLRCGVARRWASDPISALPAPLGWTRLPSTYLVLLYAGFAATSVTWALDGATRAW